MLRLSPRVIASPVTILVFAAVLSWWAGRQSDVHIVRLQTAVTEWCDAAARGENPAARLPADAFITRPLAALLIEVCAGATSDRITVQIAAGPGPGHESVKSTHHAFVLLDTTPRLGINFLVSGEKTTIAGYWKVQ